MSVTVPGNRPDLSSYIPGWTNLPRSQREAKPEAAPQAAAELAPADEIQPNFWENVVAVTGPDGTQPYNPRFYASGAGADWLGKQAQEAAERLGVASPGITEKPTFEGGPFAAPPQRMLGEMNAGFLLSRIKMFGPEWGQRVIEAIVQRAADKQA